MWLRRRLHNLGMYKASGIQSMPLNTVRVIWRAAGAEIGSLHVWALETAGANVAGYRAMYVCIWHWRHGSFKNQRIQANRHGIPSSNGRLDHEKCHFKFIVRRLDNNTQSHLSDTCFHRSCEYLLASIKSRSAPRTHITTFDVHPPKISTKDARIEQICTSADHIN